MKKYLITGLLIWIPLAITIWVLDLIVSTMDQSLLLLPRSISRRSCSAARFPAWRAAHRGRGVRHRPCSPPTSFGRRLLSFWENLLGRIPVVKTIYSAVKQVSDTLFAPGGQAFSKALLVPVSPRGQLDDRVSHRAAGRRCRQSPARRLCEHLCPTTPNPTSGFFLMMPRADVIELDMSVDEALKYVISMGVAFPEQPGAKIQR